MSNTIYPLLANGPPIPPLETECPACKGEGGVYYMEKQDRTWGTCGVCRGLKTVPTEFGQNIIDMLNRHHHLLTFRGGFFQ